MGQKDAFGNFVLERRKELGLTQKKLASMLFVTESAVSKWERGLSMPDISLLVPLAEILEVSVTELLEGKRLDSASEMSSQQVEDLVKKAITLSEESPEKKARRRRKNAAVFGAYTAAALLLTVAAVLYIGTDAVPIQLWMIPGLSFLFGLYFWLFIKERLPAYYDENEIHYYSDGVLRMNMIGVRFSNANWGHIVKGLRLWSALSMVTAPTLQFVIAAVSRELVGSVVTQTAILLVYLGAMILSIYIPAKKYG